MQWLNQQGGLLTHVEIEGTKARAYKMVPTTHWHNGNKFPYEVEKDLKTQTFKRVVEQGLEYYLVPESTINAVGQVTQYAATEDPQNIPEVKTPVAVQKYLKRESRKSQKLGDT